MKKIAITLLLATSLAACQKAPEPVAVEDGGMETLEESQSQVPLAETTSDTIVTDMNAADDMPIKNDAELEAEDAAMDAQAAEDETRNNPFELLNSGATNDIYIYRDRATGCEFITAENDGYKSRSISMVARPNGRGGQRGCGTGTDFKKAK